MKALVKFIIENGVRHNTPATVIDVERRAGNTYLSTSGDIFTCRPARVADKKRHGVDLVVVA